MTNAIVPINMPELMEIGKVMAASGFFEDARQANQAIVKVLAGRELGFGPFASMTGIHIIKGKPVISANLYAAAIRGSGRYDYKVIRLDDTGCELAFFENGKEVGRSAFTDKDAKAAGLVKPDSNWLKFPRNMYFARALSNGVKWFAPDVFGGTSVYTPGEMGEETTVDLSTGEIVTVTAAPVTQESAPTPRTPDALREHLRNSAHVNANEPELTVGWRDGIIATIDKMTEPDGHHAFLAWAFDSTGSRKDITNGQLHALKGWLQTHSETQVVEGKDGQREEKKVWVLNEIPAAELLAAYPVALAAHRVALDFPAAEDLHPASAHLEPA